MGHRLQAGNLPVHAAVALHSVNVHIDEAWCYVPAFGIKSLCIRRYDQLLSHSNRFDVLVIHQHCAIGDCLCRGIQGAIFDD